MLGMVLMFTGAPARAAPAPVPNADMGIIPPSRVSIPGYTPGYERYSAGAYTWDEDYGFTALGDQTWNKLANMLLLINAVIVKWAIRALEWAFTVPLVNDLLSAVDPILKALAAVLMANWILQFGVIFAGAAAVWYGVVQRRMSQAIGLMANVFLVLVIAYASLNGFLVWAVQSVNDASTAVAGQMLAGMSSVATPGAGEAAGGNSFVAGSEALWGVFVVTPWATGEFNGNMSTAQKYAEHGIPGGKFLGMTEKDRVREYEKQPAEVRETEFGYWQEGISSIYRVVLAFFALLVGLAGSLLILGLSGAVLVFSLLAVFILLCGPFVWLAALFVPGSGIHWTMKWFLRWLGYLATKVAFAAVLSVVIAVSMALTQMSASSGWGFSALLQVLLVIAVVVGAAQLGFKKAIGDVAQGNPQRLFMQMQQRAASRPAGAAAGAGGGGGILGVLARRGGAVGGVAGWVQGRQEGREAHATLNQKLATDQLHHARMAKAGKKPEPTELMKTTDYRRKKGAKRDWTASEIKAEVGRNRQLREIGADPLAVPANAVSEEAYQRQVDAVLAATVQTEQRTQKMRATYQPRVRAQRLQRSIPGQVAHAVWSGRLKDEGHGPIMGPPAEPSNVPMPESDERQPVRIAKPPRKPAGKRPQLVKRPTIKAPRAHEEPAEAPLMVRVWLKSETNGLQDAEVSVADDGSARVKWDDGRSADVSWDWVRERATEDSRPTLKRMRTRTAREKATATPTVRGGKK